MLFQALSMVFDGEMKTISGCRQKCKQTVLSLGASLERSHSWTSFIWSKWSLPVISYDRNIQWSRWSIHFTAFDRVATACFDNEVIWATTWL